MGGSSSSVYGVILNASDLERGFRALLDGGFEPRDVSLELDVGGDCDEIPLAWLKTYRNRVRDGFSLITVTAGSSREVGRALVLFAQIGAESVSVSSLPQSDDHHRISPSFK